MKRLIYYIIPVFLTIIIVFAILKIFVLQDAGKGALQVTSRPFAKVYLENTYLGTTPLCRCEITNMIRAGSYVIRLVPLDGQFQEFQERISITKDVLTVVDRKFGRSATSEGSIISLEPISDKKSAELLVLSNPDKADVFVDATAQGITTLHLNSMTDSDHTIRLKKDGYNDKNIRIRTPLGYKLIATVYLSLENAENSPTPNPQASVSATPILNLSLPEKQKLVILQTPNGFLRVRSQPSLASEEIDRVLPGETFSLIEESNGWYKIQLKNGSLGWVSSQFAQKQ